MAFGNGRWGKEAEINYWLKSYNLFEVSPVFNGHHTYSALREKNSFNSVTSTDLELKLGVIVAESHLLYILKVIITHLATACLKMTNCLVI